MQVTVETTGQLGRRLSVEVPEEQVNAQINKRYQKLTQTVQVPGFRKGKVPLRLIQERFASAVRQEVVGELIETTLREAIEQHKLKPAGMPSLEDFKPEVETGPLKYTAVFEVYPEIQLVALNGATVEKLIAEIAEGDIETILEKMRHQHKTWQPATRPAQNGDQVVIDFAGTIDGEAFEGGEAKDFEVTLGEKRMLPEFEQSLIGAKEGSELTVNVPFPADYHAANLAGKTAQFKIKAHKVQEPKLPALDDELAKLFNVKEGGLSALREEVRKNMGRELTHRIRDRLKDAALKKLIELNPIEVPKALVDAEILQSKKAFFERAGMRGDIKPELLAMIPDDRFKEEATRRVQVGLLLTHIISSEKMKVDPQKVHDKVTELAAVYDEPDQMIAYIYSHKDQLRQIEGLVFEEQVIDKLLTEATVVEKSVAYAELMELAADNAAAA